MRGGITRARITAGRVRARSRCGDPRLPCTIFGICQGREREIPGDPTGVMAPSARGSDGP
ncbi:unnamed protein product [[Actinomadura] parvosata subsp. kistnae]|nr:unnamed protein product [Actinomadura parvosata subsp. kistnae]